MLESQQNRNENSDNKDNEDDDDAKLGNPPPTSGNTSVSISELDSQETQDVEVSNESMGVNEEDSLSGLDTSVGVSDHVERSDESDRDESEHEENESSRPSTGPSGMLWSEVAGESSSGGSGKTKKQKQKKRGNTVIGAKRKGPHNEAIPSLSRVQEMAAQINQQSSNRSVSTITFGKQLWSGAQEATTAAI